MIFRKLAFIAASSAMLLACSDDSGNGGSSISGVSNSTANQTMFSVPACQVTNDPTVKMQLQKAAENMVDVFEFFAEGEIEKAQSVSASTRAVYSNILASNDSDCDAQLGLALAIMANISNNPDVNNLIKEFSDGSSSALFKLSTEDAPTVLAKSSMQSSPNIQTVQDAAAKVIPSVDSAIIYLRNIVGTKGYSYTFNYDGRAIELDLGEFAPALGALHLAKAFLVTVASLNLDASYKGSYSWIDSLESTSWYSTGAVSIMVGNSDYRKHLISLFEATSPFSSVKPGWMSSYTMVPALLDSAITNVQKGLNYGIEESRSGFATQMNDPYVVGNGRDADVSARDFQKAIDSLEVFKKSLKQGVAVDVNGRKVVVNLGRLFSITGGFQQYAPYHQWLNETDFYIPSAKAKWESEFSKSRSYATHYIAESFDKQLHSVIPQSRIDEIYFCSDDHLHVYVDDHELTFNIYFDGCNYTFASEDDIAWKQLSYSLPSDVCKVMGSEGMFLNNSETVVPNVMNFTDRNGNVTVGVSKVIAEGYGPRELAGKIIFPDYTFGGVFPNMTERSFWDLMDSLD